VATLHGWLGVHMAIILYRLIFQRARERDCAFITYRQAMLLPPSESVGDKCTVAFACTGRATRWALHGFLVLVLFQNYTPQYHDSALVSHS